VLGSGSPPPTRRRNFGKKGRHTDRRRLWLNLDDADYIRQTLGFSGCRLALRIDRDLIAADGAAVSHDTRYFVTSLDPGAVNARQLLAYVRGHWQIENSLHFLKDRWWDEDRHPTRRPGLGEVFAQLNSCATSVLRASYPDDQPLRARADYIAWNPRLGLQLLGLI
jgi:predicted transposase YbfD/YdcC